VLETNGEALVQFLQSQRGTLHLCLEEGTQSAWLVEILAPHVDRIVVARLEESRGPKDDQRDAFSLAERLRIGAIHTPVYKDQGPYATLRQAVKVHQMVVGDSARVQNRIKALFRSRGVAVSGKGVYRRDRHEQWIAKLPASSQGAARLLYAQYDAVREVRARATKALREESHRHWAAKLLETCPGLGLIRAAQVVSVVVVPERFRRRQQFWSYCGLAIVRRSSSDWVQAPNGNWNRAKVQQTRGLNLNHNHMLKNVFKGAAKTVIGGYPNDALHKDYERLLAGGTKPNLAALTIARKIAAIALAMWKRKEEYDPAKYRTPAS
jgi:transposase